MAANVIVYSTSVCPYCVRAKQLLERKGVAYKEVNLSVEAPEVRAALMISLSVVLTNFML